MNDTQQRIREDLVDALDGEIRTDDVTLGIYATDASLYEIRPLAVVFPRHHDDVVTVMRYASETKTPVIARGAGSGVSGGAVGEGIVVDFSRHMTGVIEVKDRLVRVEPGITRNVLNRHLRPLGLYFAPDPANSETTTIGSMVAVNASGSHSVRVGSTRDHVHKLTVVTADGATLKIGPTVSEEKIHEPAPVSSAENGSETIDELRLRDIERMLARLTKRHAGLIDEKQSVFVGESSGYFLKSLANHRASGLTDLISGSEGTLGLITEVTLHLTPLAAARGALFVLFDRLEDAVSAAMDVANEQPSACDLIDRRLLTLARDSVPIFADRIPANAEAALIVDFFAHSDEELNQRLDRVEALLARTYRTSHVGLRADLATTVDDLWRLPQRIVPLLAKLPGAARPLPFVEDIQVPPQRWSEFLPRVQRIMQRHEVTSSFYAHALAGKIHMRPFLPLPRTVADRDRIESLARDIYSAVFDCGGTMSPEHGDGFSRTAFVRSRYGALYPVFREVKRLFDPDNILNPNTIVSDDQRVTIRNIRVPAQVVDVPLQLNWPGESFTAEINACNGCGDCRRTDSASRMCPVFRLDADEQASPRAKANILRSLLDGTTPEGVTAAEVINSPSMRELTQTCFNCKQCRIDCPSHVDIPRLVIEARAAEVAANGLRGASWNLSRAHSFGRLGCAISPLANWALGNGMARWCIEKAVGIARQRKLPKFARRPFVKTLRKAAIAPANVRDPNSSSSKPNQAKQESKREVVYFVDHFANYHDVELAASAVAVLRHNGWTVHVPPAQDASGMAMVSAGDLDAARDVAEANVRVLARYVSQGMPIVCSEPAAVLCLREEYPRLLDHLDVSHVAGSVTGVGELLYEQYERGELKTDFGPLPMTVLAHTPCHVKALGRGEPLKILMSLIPELKVVPIEKGCSGMAGAYGLTAENFADSLRIGWDLMETMRETDADAGITSCSGCRMQMEQRTGRPTLHPLKLLAASYGLLPNFSKRLQTNRSRLTIS